MSVLLRAVVSQFLIIKVLSLYVQPQIQPYLQTQLQQQQQTQLHPQVQRQPQPQLQQQYLIKPYVPNISSPVQSPPKPYPEPKAYYQPSYSAGYPNFQYQKTEPTSPPRPLVPEVNKAPPKIDVEQPATKCSGNLDTNVLNNLAIALQLLIVNNIISNPPQDINNPLSKVLEITYPDQDFQMPNSKFLGTSNFGNDIYKGVLGVSSLGTSPISTSRSGISLMSPYDAIANSVPLSESLTSSYLSKKDFQNPYAAIMTADNNQDLFSMADLF